MSASIHLPIPLARAYLLLDVGTDRMLKLRRDEFLQIPAEGAEFIHVNAAPCTHRAGERYAAVVIATSESDGAEQTLIDVSMSRTVECLQTIDLSSVNEIPEELLATTIGRPGTHAGLCELMVRRYGALRGWTAEDAARRPVMVSRLRAVPCVAPN